MKRLHWVCLGLGAILLSWGLIFGNTTPSVAVDPDPCHLHPDTCHPTTPTPGPDIASLVR